MLTGMDTSRAGNLVRSWLWALAPLYTLGFGTAPLMAHAAVRTRSVWQAVTVPVYVAALVMVLVFDPDNGGIDNTLFSVGMSVNVGIGLVHAVVIRGWVFREPGISTRRASLKTAQDRAVSATREQREARERARALAAKDPSLARELGIGRPDRRDRDYPDGGLVDVNHVSAYLLSRVLRIPANTARRIVTARDQAGGFDSFEDMALLLDTTDLDEYADRMIFLPRS